ncbi:MAG TPA: type II secretion system F family protein, partial [Acidimicrobiales bacterium]|nr:type II secretion system F family protein [Acidimicrobiales bacterium]
MTVALAVAGAVVAAAASLGQVQRWLAAARAGRRLGAVAPGARPAATLPGAVRLALERAGLGDDAERLVGLWGVGLVAAGLAAVAMPSGRILVAVVAMGPPLALRLAGGRLARQRLHQLPDALDAVAAGLRGGLALPAAVAGAGAVGPPLEAELRDIARAVEDGRPLTDALERWVAGAGDAHTQLAGAALTVAARVGGPGARAVDGAAASLRERLASDAEAAALATQGKASAAVLTVAPLGFAFLLTSLDPGAGRFLLGTPVGWLCIAVGLALDAIGAWWMAAL